MREYLLQVAYSLSEREEVVEIFQWPIKISGKKLNYEPRILQYTKNHHHCSLPTVINKQNFHKIEYKEYNIWLWSRQLQKKES